MSPFFRQTSFNTAGLIIRRALPNQNVAVVPVATTPVYRCHSIQFNRNIQTAPVLRTEHHETNADRLGKRDTLNPSRAEGTQSGTDDEVAHHDAPFDPSNTAPESEIEATGRESAERKKTSNPLDVSPGNREVNEMRDPSKDTPESGVDKPPSARGWTRKGKVVNQDG